jgi:transposase
MQPQEYVGIDLHRRRSVIVRMNAEGEKLSCVRLPNDPVEVASEMAKAGESPEVVIEATYGWYWLVDLLQEHGANVHLAHPSGLKWEGRRVKNDLSTPPTWPTGSGCIACPRRG